MEDPNHTAQWLQDRVFALMDADTRYDAGEISLLLHILDSFESALGEDYQENGYASEKIAGASVMLRRAIGADPSPFPRAELLQFAVNDLGTLANLDFIPSD